MSKQFTKELRDLLKKYNATIEVRESGVGGIDIYSDKFALHCNKQITYKELKGLANVEK